MAFQRWNSDQTFPSTKTNTTQRNKTSGGSSEITVCRASFSMEALGNHPWAQRQGGDNALPMAQLAGVSSGCRVHTHALKIILFIPAVTRIRNKCQSTVKTCISKNWRRKTYVKGYICSLAGRLGIIRKAIPYKLMHRVNVTLKSKQGRVVWFVCFFCCRN